MPVSIPANPPLWPLLLYFALVLILVIGMLTVAYVLGERHRERSTDIPYESGMLPTGTARLRFPADFYLIAMLFVIFDLESVYIVAWSIAIRQLKWTGYAAIAIFIGLVFAMLIYLWRVGALDWGLAGRRVCPLPQEKTKENNAVLQ